MYEKEMFVKVLKYVNGVQQLQRRNGIIKNMKEIKFTTQDVRFDSRDKVFYEITHDEMGVARNALNKLVKMGFLKKGKTQDKFGYRGQTIRTINEYSLTDKAESYINKLRQSKTI